VGAEAENPAGLVSLPGGAQHHHDDHDDHGPSLAAVRAFQRELQATRQTELLVCMSVNECACACACAFPLAYAALKHALQLARVDYMHVSTLAGQHKGASRYVRLGSLDLVWMCDAHTLTAIKQKCVQTFITLRLGIMPRLVNVKLRQAACVFEAITVRMLTHTKSCRKCWNLALYIETSIE
jgi:hypothetical protein